MQIQIYITRGALAVYIMQLSSKPVEVARILIDSGKGRTFESVVYLVTVGRRQTTQFNVITITIQAEAMEDAIEFFCQVCVTFGILALLVIECALQLQ